MTLGAFMLISFTFSLITVLSVLGQTEEPKSNNIVLYLEFDGALDETVAEASLMDPFGAPSPTLRDFVRAIDHATHDDRVHGIVARIKGGGLSISHVQELRTALKQFNANSDKFSYIYSSSYGAGGGGLSSLYLASAFQERWIQPLGIVSIPGINAQVPYFKQTLDNIGVGTQFYKRKEFKTAYESITNAEMSDENRKMMEALVDDLRVVLLPDMAQDLGMSTSQLEASVNKGLHTAPEAVAAGLITTSDYADRLIDKINTQVTGDPDGEDIRYVDVKKYNKITAPDQGGLAAKLPKKQRDEKAVDDGSASVALVYAVGAIMQDNAQSSQIAAAEVIAPAILDAKDNDDIKAIVLRIDSPGGSPTASESILRAIQQVREAGKPVIVSMGGTAASGGYWIASGVDRIFALPGTLTGSIGVVGGKFYLQDLWQKLGVNWESVSWGDNADLWSFNSPFSAAEAERMNAMLDHVYDSFIDRVADGRNMDRSAVEAVAKGRVWTGNQALKAGLVDELGGLNAALDYAATLVGLENRNDLNVIVMPKPKTAIERLADLLAGQVRVGHAIQSLQPVFDIITPVAREAQILRRAGPYSVYEPFALD